MATDILLNAKNINLNLLNRSWTVLRADMEVLWDEMVETSQDKAKLSKWLEDERLPYYAELWASSLALCNWLGKIQKEIQGKNCLDLGCGLGLTTLCASYLGAKVLGVDYEENAIILAKKNAEINGFVLGNGLSFQMMDWREPNISPNSFDFIWAADIVYERSFINPIIDFLEYALKPKAKFYIAEPGRSIFDDFPRELIRRKFQVKKVHFEKTKLIEPYVPEASVNIWEIYKHNF